MIVDLRVDDRLIHGQVALVWTKKLGAAGIVVANDKASKDNVQQMTLKMAVPESVKLSIRSIQGAAELLNNPKAENMRIFVLVDKVTDALELVKLVKGICRINIANTGRFDGVEETEKVKLNSTILLSAGELEALKELISRKIPVVTQVVPDNAEKKIEELLKKIN